MSKTHLRHDQDTEPWESPEYPGLAEDKIHELLRNNRRRAVLRIVHQQETTTAREVAERIAAEETGEEPPPRDSRQSVYISLIQTHLPKLDEWESIEYDEQAKQVASGPALDQLAQYTGEIGESTPEDSESVSAARPMLAAVVVSWLLAAGATMGVPVVASLLPVYWSALGLLGVLVVYATSR